MNQKWRFGLSKWMMILDSSLRAEFCSPPLDQLPCLGRWIAYEHKKPYPSTMMGQHMNRPCLKPTSVFDRMALAVYGSFLF